MSKHGFTIGNIIQIIILLGGLLWAASSLQSDVNDNTQWNKRQDKEHMRKDVIEVQLEAIQNQLKRIDEKID